MPRFDVLPRQRAGLPDSGADGRGQHHPAARARGARRRHRPDRGPPAGPDLGAPGLQPARAREGRAGRRSWAPTVNTTYNPGVPSILNSGINPATPHPAAVPPGLPIQNPLKVWTFNGTMPPKLLHRALRRADPVPPPQPAAVRRHAERRLRASTRSRPTSTTATTERRTTASPGRSSSRASSTTTTGRSCWPGTRPSTPARPIRMAGGARRQRRHHQGAGRLARDDEHPLVPRPHVQLHVAERLQGQRRDVQHLQRARSRQRGHRRRRQPAAAERQRRRRGATSTTT